MGFGSFFVVVYSGIGKKGTIWTAGAHIITGVIGAGVLSLSWSIAQLGWIAGPLAIILFAVVTLFATTILCDCYKSPDSLLGPTINHTLLEAAGFYLGKLLFILYLLPFYYFLCIYGRCFGIT